MYWDGSTSCELCPSGYTVTTPGKAASSCIAVTTQPAGLSYAAARASCGSAGDLLVPRYARHVGDIALLCGASGGCWLGGRTDAAGDVHWFGGSTLDLGALFSSTPGPNECVRVQSSGQLSTSPCGDSVAQALCEVPGTIGFQDACRSGYVLEVMCLRR